jgi:hypothetical protein
MSDSPVRLTVLFTSHRKTILPSWLQIRQKSKSMILLFKKHQSDKSTRSPTLVVIFLLHESGQTMTFFMFGKLAVPRAQKKKTNALQAGPPR